MAHFDNDDSRPSARLNRPTRNNNPGNIEYGPFAKSQGAVGSDGRFAIFKTTQQGFKALETLLQTDRYQSKTLAGAIAAFAPPHENNTPAYIRYVEKRTGVDRHTRLGDLSPDELRKVALAKATYEGWKPTKGEPLFEAQPSSRRTDRTMDRGDDMASGRSGSQKNGLTSAQTEQVGGKTDRRLGRRDAEGGFETMETSVPRTVKRVESTAARTSPDIDDAATLPKGSKSSIRADFSGAAPPTAAKPESRTEEAPKAPTGSYPYLSTHAGFSDRGDISFSSRTEEVNNGIKTDVKFRESFTPAAAGVPQTPPTQMPPTQTPSQTPDERPIPRPSHNPHNLEWGWNG